MKVVFIAPFPPAHDGIGNYSQMMCDELVRQGHEVGVVMARPAAPTLPEVIGSVPGPLVPAGPTLAAVHRFDPDVVHLQFAVAAYGARLRSLIRILERLRREGYPIVATFHEITRDLGTLGTIGVAAYRRVAQRVDRVIVHTETAQRTYQQAIGLHGTPAIVAHPRARLPSPTVTGAQLRDRYALGDDRVVLSFGFIHVDKGVSDLLRAAGILARQGGLDGARIVIAGEVRRRVGVLRPFELRDRLYLRQLNQIIADERLQEHVVFTGYVPSGEVRGWFDLASVAVLPYHRIEQSGAGSLARGAGTPLLTTDVGELAKLGTFPPVPPHDPSRLAESLRAVLSGDVEPDEDHQRGSELGVIVAETSSIYAQIVPVSHRSSS